MNTDLNPVPHDSDLPWLTDAQIHELVDELVSAAGTEKEPAGYELGPSRVGHSRRLAVVVAAAACLAGAAVIGTSYLGTSTPAAASWASVPSVASPSAAAEITSQCQRLLGSTAGLAVLDTRGTTSFALLTDSSQCLIFGSQQVAGGIDAAGPPLSGSAIHLVDNASAGGSERTDPAGRVLASDMYFKVIGQVGPDVTAVVIHRASGGNVTATVQNGWFLAWWPGDASGTSLTITSPTGQRTEAM